MDFPEDIIQILASQIHMHFQGLSAELSIAEEDPQLMRIIGQVTSHVVREYLECEVKRKIVMVCRRFYEMGFLAGTSGNISIRLNEGEILITGRGLNKGALAPADIIKVNLEGEKIDGEGNPSSEMKMHLHSYSKRKDVNAIVHSHPPFATGFAAAGIPLDRPVLPEAILVLGSIPLVDYGTPSTWEVPIALDPYLANHNTFLLANHGALTLGANLEEAAHRTETLELFAQVILIARMLGGEKLLTQQNLEKLARLH